MRTILFAAFIVLLTCAAVNASEFVFSFGFGYGSTVVYTQPYVYTQTYVTQPYVEYTPSVLVAPAPVIYAPPPVVYAPPPVIYRPYVYTSPIYRHPVITHYPAPRHDGPIFGHRPDIRPSGPIFNRPSPSPAPRGPMHQFRGGSGGGPKGNGPGPHGGGPRR